MIRELAALKNGTGNLDQLLKYSMLHTQLEQKLLQDTNAETTEQIEKLLYEQSMKLSEGKHMFLQYYYQSFYK